MTSAEFKEALELFIEYQTTKMLLIDERQRQLLKNFLREQEEMEE